MNLGQSTLATDSVRISLTLVFKEPVFIRKEARVVAIVGLCFVRSTVTTRSFLSSFVRHAEQRGCLPLRVLHPHHAIVFKSLEEVVADGQVRLQLQVQLLAVQALSDQAGVLRGSEARLVSAVSGSDAEFLRPKSGRSEEGASAQN